MTHLNKWAITFPRLYELYCEDPANSDNHFNHPNVQQALQRIPPDQYLTELDSILGELDPVAWQEWKGRAAETLSVKNRSGYPFPLFESFIEARAYVFLKQQGYVNISFLNTQSKQAKKTPDLVAKNGQEQTILLEAKRIRDSDDEIEYLVSPFPKDMRKVHHGLTDAMRGKLTRTVEKARKQLFAFEGADIVRRIVFLWIRIDLQSATKETETDISGLLTEMSDDTVEIVHFIENESLL